MTEAASTDLGEQMQRLTLRVVVAALFGDSADRVVLRCGVPSCHLGHHHPARARRGAAAHGGPDATARRGRVARDDLFRACERSWRRVAPGGPPATPTCSPCSSPRGTTESRSATTRCGFRCSPSSSPVTRRPRRPSRSRSTSWAATRRSRTGCGRRRDAVGEGRPTAATTASLPLTTAVVLETTRLYPSAPFLGRLAVEDDEVMGFAVPAGTTVVVPPWTVHRHPAVWADPLTFDPLSCRGGAAPPPVRVDAVRRRAASMHRPALLDGGGRAHARPRAAGAPRPRSPTPTTCR